VRGALGSFLHQRPGPPAGGIGDDVARAMVSYANGADSAAEPGGLAFPAPRSAPNVSIVVPVYGQIDHTLHCLRALSAQWSSSPFEVIVVDDCSEDRTGAVLERIDGLNYLRNPENLGFVHSCNRGAEAAAGEILVFLNNDTIVLPGWLDRLKEVFDRRADAGAVGSMLLWPDGRLQEAGATVSRSGDGWNYGRDGDPNDCRFNYLREATYCSGASLAVRRDVWRDVGGFDTGYAPAYYEDTDLAFRIRSIGLRVYYQPFSRVIHFEGVTSGRSFESGVKQFQVRNRPRFAARWQAELQAYGASEDLPSAPLNRYRTRTLLWVEESTPVFEDCPAFRLNLDRAEQLLGLGWEIHFLPYRKPIHAGVATERMQARGICCLYRPYIASGPSHLKASAGGYDAVLLSGGAAANPLAADIRRSLPDGRIVERGLASLLARPR
jgi:GT2 family glycosyltransferase